MNKELIKANLNTFSGVELKKILQDYNAKFVAMIKKGNELIKEGRAGKILGWTKYTKKEDLINFLVEKHLEKFKELKDKQTYADIYKKTYSNDEEYKKYKENRTKLSPFDRYMIEQLAPNKDKLKRLKNYMYEEYAIKNKPLPEELKENKEAVKAYKEAQKLIKDRAKRAEKNKREANVYDFGLTVADIKDFMNPIINSVKDIEDKKERVKMFKNEMLKNNKLKSYLNKVQERENKATYTKLINLIKNAIKNSLKIEDKETTEILNIIKK